MAEHEEGEEPELAVHALGVKNLKVEDLTANPHNPRMLFDEEPLAVLRESIRKVGILVPLTVYREVKTGRYIILDGQRRWMCAKEIGKETVPVNEVGEPSLVQNIITMFQIHKLRKDWALMPTALKLAVLMRAMRERNDEKLAKLTGLDKAVVARCKKLLDYPKKYHEMMLDPEPKARIKADFFIELYAVRNDRTVNSMDWFTKDGFTDRMLDRYSKGRLRSVTDFRIIKEHISNARVASRVKTIARRLQEYAEDTSLGLDHLEFASARAASLARSLEKRVDKIIEELAALDPETVLGEENLWLSLESLMVAIRKKLQDAGRRPKG